MKRSATTFARRDARHTTPYATVRRLLRLDMIAAFRATMEMDGMRNEWVDRWVREAVGVSGVKKPEPATTTYNVGGVPLSVTGAHVAFMIVPESEITDERNEGERR